MTEYYTEEEHAYHEPEAVLERSKLTRKQILLESAQALENYLDTKYCRLLRAMSDVVPECMNWTTEKPTTKGHYWWCEYPCSDVMPICVGETNGNLWAWFNGYEDKLERMKGWFMGPISVPEPPASAPY